MGFISREEVQKVPSNFDGNDDEEELSLRKLRDGYYEILVHRSLVL